MKIILDAMGGDNAPEIVVRGALLALQEMDVELALVGRGEDILRVLESQKQGDIPRGMEIVHASEVIGMEEDPAVAVREKEDSSIVVGLKLLAEGYGGAFVSAGSTGAVLTGATLKVKRIKGIRRAALSPLMPTAKGPMLLIDCGANAECTSEYLMQFAYMGAAFMARTMGKSRPRVGLLNIGTEEKKGGPLRREAFQLLNRPENKPHFDFVGNVEGRDVVFGAADVVVTDGFSGNILLKTMEGAGLFFIGALKDIFMKSVKTKLAAGLVKNDLRGFKKMLDYTEYGGAPFLGVSQPVIKAHGSSNDRAICSAIRQAVNFAESGVVADIERNIGLMKTLTSEKETAQ